MKHKARGALSACILAGAMFLAGEAWAHEIWVERDASGAARIYLGEPADVLPPGGDPEFPKLQAPKVFSAPDAKLQRRAGYIEVSAPAGDVRVFDDTVFRPWNVEGKKAGVAYYARAGRAETSAIMHLEFVPTAENGDEFLLIRSGAPVKEAKVTLISPQKWTKDVRTDADGKFKVPIGERGRYIVTASVEDNGKYSTPLGEVDKLYHITTLTFVAP